MDSWATGAGREVPRAPAGQWPPPQRAFRPPLPRPVSLLPFPGCMHAPSCSRYDQVQVLRGGEVTHQAVCHRRGLVRRHHIVEGAALTADGRDELRPLHTAAAAHGCCGVCGRGGSAGGGGTGGAPGV